MKAHNWVDILNSHEDQPDAEEIEDEFVFTETETNEGNFHFNLSHFSSYS